MKLMLGLLGVVAAATYGAVTLAGAAPLASVSPPVPLNVPIQVQSRAPAALTAKPPTVILPPAPAVDEPAALSAVQNPIAEPGPNCDIQVVLAQLQAARGHGRLSIMQVAPELELAGCSAANIAAIASRVDPANAGRWRGGDQTGGGGDHEAGD